MSEASEAILEPTSPESTNTDSHVISKNWTEIAQPKRMKFERESLSESYGKFFLEPLEPGFGITIGHALRRIILSSIRGATVFAVQVEGVSHEFGNIPGVYEDIIEILLNIKELQIEQFSDEVVEMELIGEGPCVLTGADIATFEKASIRNLETKIATLEENATISMTIYSRFNKGYVTSEENQKEDLPVGTIYLDANHSPIRRVKYEVENAMVEQRTDYDRLVMELWTNGAVRPQDSLAYAAKILKEHTEVFINFDENSPEEDPEEEAQMPDLNENLWRSVSELELSVRSINCLQNAKIETIGDLVQKTEQEMLKTKNFGRKSLNEIKEILVGMGISLGMELEGFDPANNPFEKNKTI